ncbi:molybdenum ABC transporter substrate-binding protein [Geoalkalibacter ferrihydriticus DSM 17813]|uniref:Molybdenum ABC transporter substrate-binding protein n=1 Tax=Geoalkalibacter ferrihydriticus DSM 17813 TaxID=1121915 RepID=A0A0C2HTM2_9BACT|nr:molybdenum ABC transporter substrate-binding protein [Geoalkalibacter ferrihydriticus DSM 17813]
MLFQLFCAGAVRAAEVRVSAAASMAEALREIAAAYTQMSPAEVVIANFGASGALARQIEQGAPADLYLSANAQWVEYLIAAGRIAGEDVRTLAGNSLVFVGRSGLEVTTLADLSALGRIALVNPRSAPAGEYAQQALDAVGVYAALAGKLVMAQDVRQAVVYADRGEVDGALVYKSDALLARQAVILHEVPAHLHNEISYPAALTTSGRNNPNAVAFFNFLQSDTARRILHSYGFIVEEEVLPQMTKDQ